MSIPEKEAEKTEKAEEAPSVSQVDIQHDDEFEDFKVKYNERKESNQQGDWMDDWDDDVVEDFAAMLAAERKKLGQ